MSDPSIAFPDIAVSELSLTFTASQPVPMPRFAGSAWRGAFGHALKRTVCTMRLRPCAGCALAQACWFPSLFAPAPEAQAGLIMSGRPLPPPYVLDPGETPREGFFAPGAPIPVRLALFGAATRAAAYAALALLRAAEGGVGPARVALRPATVGGRMQAQRAFSEAALRDAMQPAPLPSAPPPYDRVRLRFETPLRLRLANDLVTPAAFRPAYLLGAAVRRVSLLVQSQTGVPLEADFRALKAAAAPVEWIETRLGWVETRRYSTRQQARLAMGGIVGEAALDIARLGPLWSFLWLGQALHLGKGASMGFGRYRILPA
jgi:hypothetical protein